MPRSDYWIKIFDSFPNHQKVRKLAEIMDWNMFEARGFLVSFWLQVASDAPDGVLARLATLDAVLKALGVTKGKILVRIKSAMKAVALLDEDEDGACRVHDWESGGGQLEKTRRGDAGRQREHWERGRKGGEPPAAGADAGRHGDVTGESKSNKSKNIPPYPPQAGGEFQVFQEQVLTAWREECARVPVEAVRDNPTTRGVARFAHALLAGEIVMETVRLSMRGFLAMKYGGDSKATEMRSWNLDTCAKSPSTYLPKRTPPPPPPAAMEAEETVRQLYRCDLCGLEVEIPTPVSDRATPLRCHAGRKVGKCCTGMLRPVLSGDSVA